MFSAMCSNTYLLNGTTANEFYRFELPLQVKDSQIPYNGRFSPIPYTGLKLLHHKESNLHNEELHSLYRSPNIVRVIKSRRLRWTGHVAWRKVGVLSKF